MEQILIRNLPEGTKAILRKRATEHDSSIEAEARAILAAGLAVDKPTLVDLISMSGDAEVDFEPQRLSLQARTPEL
ncbi:antitoxin [Brevibacterium aurantiacum]|nr:antitoxin [Brevibacterium aurantiacum]